MGLFLLVDIFLRFAHNSFEEQQAATCRFSTEFRKNREMYQPIGRKGLNFIREYCMHSMVFKRVL
jgi:hypothetical protein